MSQVKSRVSLKPGADPARAPLVGLETYDPEAVVEVLRSFREGEAEEQRETLEYLMKALNEGRPEGQKIFLEE